jgi:glycosyltransferase involved in cell wall biosynthesis
VRRKRILVVGMIDSIHLARWLTQLMGSEHDIRVLPSAHFKRVHPKLLTLRSREIRIPLSFSLGRLFPYVDYFLCFGFLNTQVEQIFRRAYITTYIKLFKPSIIHAIEIQHAGYIASKIRYKAEKRILTNWGSDIYYFQHFPKHQKQIQLALDWATHYSAECSRDYELAKVFNFQGVDLPRIPNAGGFALSSDTPEYSKNKDQIIIKCYGGTFGLGEVALSVARKFLTKNVNATLFLYSVTNDLIPLVKDLQRLFPERLAYSLQSNPLPYEDLALKFQHSIIYLGISKSDGLSTSFLEALIHGVYPIQTNTSCASELIHDGAIGSIVGTEVDEIYNELERVYRNKKLLESARISNYSLARITLDERLIREIARDFYL